MGDFLATEADFSAFYSRNATELLMFFARRTFDPQASLDLTAESFVQAFASRRTFRGTDSDAARAWLFAIARRQLAKYFEAGHVEAKVRSRLRGRMPTATDDDLERIEELAGLADQRVILREQLKSLSPEQREAIWLRVVEERPYAAVARQLGVTEQVARAKVSRALRTLALTFPPIHQDRCER
jgi:RNA polymerase sigma-70 factor (ECF subfamily)